MAKINNSVFRILLTLASLVFISCGGGGGGGDEPIAELSETDLNPVAVSTEYFGSDGNLYKPVADAISSGAGNLVVLFSAKYSKQFERCETRLKDGSIAQLTCINNQPWTHIPYSCFANGNRQTWRANFTCWDVAEVSVTCYDFNQEITFTVPDEQKSQICSRFG